MIIKTNRAFKSVSKEAELRYVNYDKVNQTHVNINA